MKNLISDKRKLIFLCIGFLTLILPQFISLGIVMLSITVWLYPLCFLYLTRNAENRKELLFVWLFYILGAGVRFCTSLGNSFLLILASFLISALGFTALFVPFLIDRRIHKRSNRFIYTLIFPLAYTTAEMLINLMAIGSLQNIGYTQIVNPIFSQSASLIGEFGIGFFVMWTPCVVLYVFEFRKRKIMWLKALIWILVAVMSFSYGVVRLKNAKEYTPDDTVKIAYTTGPYVGDFVSDFSPTDLSVCMDSLNKSCKTAKQGGAGLLMYCEEAFTIYDYEEKPFIENAKEQAKNYSMNILVTLLVLNTDENSSKEYQNNAYIIGSDGRMVVQYKKQQLVPVIESFFCERSSTGIPNVWLNINGKDVKATCAICFDAEYSKVISFMDNDTSLLLVSSWDWENITQQHTANVRVRALENGVGLLKDTYDGTSVATDAFDRVVASTHTSDVGFETVNFADVPIDAQTTHFEKYVIYVNYLCPLTLLVLMFTSRAFSRKRREEQTITE